MSWLTLVRHGQASFHAADYDRLSAVGERQARLLGEYWARRGVVFDEIGTGPRSRQRRTAELVGEVYQQQGLPWPTPVVIPELDEYDLDGLMRRVAPELAAADRAFADLVETWRQSREDHDRARTFQRMFEVLMRHWLTASTLSADVESWAAFQARVQRLLGRLREQPGRGRVALFTSGGFIGTLTQQALAAPHATALELSWRLRNGSLTEFVFTRERFTLDVFNTVPHLEDAALWTYR